MRAKARSKASNCSPLNVVRDLLCFLLRGMPGSDSVSLSSQDDGPAKNIGVKIYSKELNWDNLTFISGDS